LSSATAEGIAHHVVDRSFVDGGARWIVDYKTVRAEPGELAAKAESFRGQLERYAALFAGDGLPRRLAIYFVEQDRLVELPPAP